MRAAAFSLLIALSFFSSALAQEAGPSVAASKLPVREVTVFKDGHAFVLREAKVALGEGGSVVIDDLPAPVLGTFWPYAEGAKVVSATAARERVTVRRTALDVRQLVIANAGRAVEIVNAEGQAVRGHLVGVPVRSAEEIEREDGAAAGPAVAAVGAVALVRTNEGTRAVPLERIREITVLDEPATTFAEDAVKPRLTLRCAPDAGATVPPTVGVAYVQKGLRWIPSYRLELGEEGRAAVRMEATLVNDLVDLDGATVHLVIGVPRFEFEAMLDPIALQEAAAAVAGQMRAQDQLSNRTANFLSNAIMSQVEGWQSGEAAAPEAPGVVGGEAHEDLYVFTVRDVTLARGERLVLPVQELMLPYRDVHVLEVPFAPPLEMRESFQGDRAAELARLLAAPKAMHVLRLENAGTTPLTTAPALVLSRGRVLAQGLLRYAPVGAKTDLAINPAVDVLVKIAEKEAGRTPNAVSWSGSTYGRIDLSGTIAITNRKQKAIDLEVKRLVLGLVDEAGQGGQLEQRSLADAWGGADRPAWWRSWNWPYWWFHWNGIGLFSWKVRLEPGQEAMLDAAWHYFWR